MQIILTLEILRKMILILIKKGNKKITHDEYHRFCDKALESNYDIEI